jgi:hypothetical protein
MYFIKFLSHFGMVIVYRNIVVVDSCLSDLVSIRLSQLEQIIVDVTITLSLMRAPEYSAMDLGQSGKFYKI